jgi:hypothetical protein
MYVLVFVAPIRDKIACELYPLGESVDQCVSYSMHNSCQGWRLNAGGGRTRISLFLIEVKSAAVEFEILFETIGSSPGILDVIQHLKFKINTADVD